jgi:hypothetical protein
LELCGRRVEDRALDAIAIDVQPREEGQAEPAPRLVVGADVEPVAVLKEAEGDVEPLLDELVVDAAELDDPLRVAFFRGEDVLPLLERNDDLLPRRYSRVGSSSPRQPSRAGRR